MCRQIESQKLTFRETAKARTDHGADIIIQSESSPHRLSNTSSPGSLNAAEAPPLDTLADQVRDLPVQTENTKIKQHSNKLPLPVRCLPPLPNKACDWTTSACKPHPLPLPRKLPDERKKKKSAFLLMNISITDRLKGFYEVK